MGTVDEVLKFQRFFWLLSGRDEEVGADAGAREGSVIPLSRPPLLGRREIITAAAPPSLGFPFAE